jgi:hypothetical protein
MELARPIVTVLTDGSGSSGQPRLESTSSLLASAGATPGAIYGRFSDAGIYRTILDRDGDRFVALAEELADEFVRCRIEVVVGDAAEWYNPTHDICRMVINAAVLMSREVLGEYPANFAFPLVAPPGVGPGDANPATLCVELDDAALERKLAAARAYVELSGEVNSALEAWGADAFRQECLRFVDAGEQVTPGGIVPFYEQYGEVRVASGVYAEVIRYRRHVQPLAEALRACVERRLR